MRKRKARTERVLGFDPGTNNFGYSVVETSRKGGSKRRFKVTEAGKLSSLVSTYDTWQEELLAFYDEIANLIERTQPTLIAIERLILRRIIPRGTTVETLNAMIGMVGYITAYYGIPVVPLSAVIWKNAFNRVEELEWYYKNCCVQPHVMDATFIATYGALYWFGDQDEEYFHFDIWALYEQIREKNTADTIRGRPY